MAVEFIFVYGTLRKSIAHLMHNVLIEHADFFSNGVMQGKLFEVAEYPGAICSEHFDDKIFGEVYLIRNAKAVFEKLDSYENCSSNSPIPCEYKREKINIVLTNGENITAWVYIYNLDTSDLKEICSGDYCLYKQG